MRCPYCSFPESKVVNSRAADEGNTIRRRRECVKCARRFTTYEIVEELPLMVVKKDGRRTKFDSKTLLNGMLKACEKRGIPLNVLEDVVGKIESNIRENLEREVTSLQIGEMVMQHLKEIDQVAYLRFTSVCREFADVNHFMQEVKALEKNKI